MENRTSFTTYKRGDVCISNHPYAYRSGEPYTILNIQEAQNGKVCYFIQFEDGKIDWFPVASEKEHEMVLVRAS